MDCLIREAVNADAEAISRVVIAALRESNAVDYSPEIIADVQRSFSADAILQLLAQRKVFVATFDSVIVATASLDQDVVRSVFVDPRYQGQRIGKALMGLIQITAIDRGVKLLRVPSSITAEGFYSSLGFRTVRDEFHGAERTIIMDKRL